MERPVLRVLFVALALLGAVGCGGGGSSEAEATWETHTTAEDETSGDEAQ